MKHKELWAQNSVFGPKCPKCHKIQLTMSDQSQKFKFFEKKHSLSVRSPWFDPFVKKQVHNFPKKYWSAGFWKSPFLQIDKYYVCTLRFFARWTLDSRIFLLMGALWLSWSLGSHFQYSNFSLFFCRNVWNRRKRIWADRRPCVVKNQQCLP